MEQNTVCYATLGTDNGWTLDAYRQTGGYQSWERVINGELSEDQVIDIVKASGLRGRCVFSNRAQVELHAALSAWSEIPGLQFG